MGGRAHVDMSDLSKQAEQCKKNLQLVADYYDRLYAECEYLKRNKKSAAAITMIPSKTAPSGQLPVLTGQEKFSMKGRVDHYVRMTASF